MFFLSRLFYRSKVLHATHMFWKPLLTRGPHFGGKTDEDQYLEVRLQ
jgi:hypothetical protein